MGENTSFAQLISSINSFKDKFFITLSFRQYTRQTNNATFFIYDVKNISQDIINVFCFIFSAARQKLKGKSEDCS